MAETLTILSVLSFLLAGAFGTASIVLWLRFDIPEIMGDLSGRAARRSVRRIREENARAARAREEAARTARGREEAAGAARGRVEAAGAARAREEAAGAARGRVEAASVVADATENLEDIMIIHTDEVIREGGIVKL